MAGETLLRFLIRTPHDVVLDRQVRSVRVPTESGQVGLRPHREILLLVVEPGLLVLRTGDGVMFAGSAGGLLRAEGVEATLLTPYAVAGESGEQVLSALEQRLAAPDSELAARRRLSELERRIIREVGSGRDRRRDVGVES